MTDLRIGDIVTGYRKGIYRITEIIPRFYTHEYFKYSSYEQVEPDIYKRKNAPYDVKRVGDEYEPLIKLRCIATQTYKPVNDNREYHCSASYCVPLDSAAIADIVHAYTTNLAALEALLPEWRR